MRLTVARPLLPLLTLLAACEAAKVTIDDTAGAVDSGDSGETVDSGDSADSADSGDTADTSDTNDSAESGDTDDTALHDAFIFDLTGEWSGAGLSFVPVNVQSGAFGTPLYELAVTAARLPVALPDIPEDELEASADAPDFLYAVFVVGGFTDYDLNGARSSRESWITAGSVVAFYAGGSIPMEIAAVGIRSGWNALEGSVLTADNTLVVLPPDAVPMDLPAPVESVTVGGSYLDAPPEGLSVFAVSYTALQGGTTAAWLYDGPMTDAAFTVTVTGRPPDDHFSDLDGNGTDEDAELLVSYIDGRPAGFNDGDTPLYPACFDGAPVLLYWLDQSIDISAAFALGVYGFGSGWNVLADPKGSNPIALSEAERADLTMSGDCTF